MPQCETCLDTHTAEPLASDFLDQLDVLAHLITMLPKPSVSAKAAEPWDKRLPTAELAVSWMQASAGRAYSRKWTPWSSIWVTTQAL